MSADSHQFEIGELPNDEGNVHVLLQAWKKPSAEEVSEKRIENVLIVHNPCDNQMTFVRLNERKAVLVCKNCLLRVVLPGDTQTVANLQGHLSRC